MKTLDYLSLDKKKVSKVVDELQQLLADYQLYYTNLRGFHWNIQGKRFVQLHEYFEALYDDAAERIDLIAERILMLGCIPKHNFSQYLKESCIKETEVVNCGDEALKLILDYHKVLIKKEREILELAGEADDEGTSALMSDFISLQEKTVWMITATLA